MRITNKEIIELMNKGLIVGNLKTLTFQKFHLGRKRYKTLTFNQHPESNRWRVKIQLGTRRKDSRSRTIYRNLLVWLYRYREEPPFAHDIHHIDQDNQNDSIENLRCRDSGSNRRDNTLYGFRECSDYFEAIIFLGREPLWSTN